MQSAFLLLSQDQQKPQWNPASVSSDSDNQPVSPVRHSAARSVPIAIGAPRYAQAPQPSSSSALSPCNRSRQPSFLGSEPSGTDTFNSHRVFDDVESPPVCTVPDTLSASSALEPIGSDRSVFGSDTLVLPNCGR
jgi:hypothetical protein